MNGEKNGDIARDIQSSNPASTMSLHTRRKSQESDAERRTPLVARRGAHAGFRSDSRLRSSSSRSSCPTAPVLAWIGVAVQVALAATLVVSGLVLPAGGHRASRFVWITGLPAVVAVIVLALILIVALI